MADPDPHRAVTPGAPDIVKITLRDAQRHQYGLDLLITTRGALRSCADRLPA